MKTAGFVAQCKDRQLAEYNLSLPRLKFAGGHNPYRAPELNPHDAVVKALEEGGAEEVTTVTAMDPVRWCVPRLCSLLDSHHKTWKAAFY